MEKVKVDKLEYRFPTLFKVMWLVIVVWMVVDIANYFGLVKKIPFYNYKGMKI